MKNKIWIAAAAAASAALVAYLVRRSGKVSPTPQMIPAKRSHHITGVFAHAKNHKDSTPPVH